MNTPPTLIANYYRKHNLLPDNTINCMEYTLKSIYNELTKFVVYLIFFALIDLAIPYLVAYCVFVSLRTFAGGIHCKTYWGCFFCSFIMISSTILLAHILKNTLVLGIVSLCSITFPLVLAPVTPSFRIIKSKKKSWVLKLIASALSIAWIGIAYFSCTNTIIIYTVFLSVAITNYQLAIPRWLSKNKGGEKNEIVFEKNR